jgi:hypothetical protein
VLKASNDLVMRIEGNFLVGNEFSVAGIAISAMLGMLSMVETQYGLVKWKDQYPKSRKYWEGLEERDSLRRRGRICLSSLRKLHKDEVDALISSVFFLRTRIGCIQSRRPCFRKASRL